MEPTSVTLKETITFLSAGAQYLAAYPKERSTLTFALRKQAEKLEGWRTERGKALRSIIDGLEIQHASIHSEGEYKGNLIERKFDYKTGKDDSAEETQARYAYTPAKSQELREKIRVENEKAEAETFQLSPPFKGEPFYVALPENFDFRYLSAFRKFVIADSLTEEQELEAYLKSAPPTEKAVNGSIKPALELKK